MDDFLKGYSQGMTGNTSGQPSQSVMEAMGRDAARNQWNNTPRSYAGGQAQSGQELESIPITTVLYEAGKKMRFKKLMRDFLIAVALFTGGTFANAFIPRSLEWLLAIITIPAALFILWTLLKLPFYLIAKTGSLFESKKQGA